MKQKYTVDERKKLIDLIIAVAMEIHESGMTVADKLCVPDEVMYDLRRQSPRANMISPCICDECKKEQNKFVEWKYL